MLLFDVIAEKRREKSERVKHTNFAVEECGKFGTFLHRLDGSSASDCCFFLQSFDSEAGPGKQEVPF
ncbi:hypothetical protein Ancab_031012 [Ancistrocladus abbreviatus]